MTTSTYDTSSLDLYATPSRGAEDLEPRASTPTGRTAGIDPKRFWVGSTLSAGITAMVALVALIIGQDLLHIPMLVRDGGHLLTVSFGAYVLLAAAVAVVASALYTVILHFAPRPRLYFGWLAALGTILVVLLPLTTGTALADQLALSITNFVVGMVITFLVPVAAARTR